LGGDEVLIEKINITNFGPFYQEHEIDFSEKYKGVHVIRGGNGQGKTSLQRAILWALYGKVYDRKRQQIRETSLLNQSALKDGLYQLSVTIYFTHEGKNCILFRQMTAKSHREKSYEEGMILTLTRDGEISQDPQNEIERILPYEISRFYFFDGEMLRDYEELLEENNRSKLLKNSIEIILGVPYFRNAIDDLNFIKSRFEKRRNQAIKNCGGKSYEELSSELNTIAETFDEKNRLIAALQGQLAVIQEEISSKKSELARLKDVKEMGERRLEIEFKIKDEEKNRDEKLKNIRQLVAGLYKTLLIPISETVILRLEEKAKSSYEKYNKKQKLLGKAEMLSKGIAESKCRTCGTILNKEKLEQFEHEIKLIDEEIELLTEVPEPNLEYEHQKVRLERMKNKATNRTDFININVEINRIDSRLIQYKSELASLLQKLKDVDSEEPRILLKEIEDRISEEGRLQGGLKFQIEEFEELREYKGELEGKIKSIPRKDVNELNNAIEHISPLTDIFEEAVSLYRDDRKQEIENIATSIFHKIRSKDEFDRLKINDQFGLSIITNNGTILDRSEWRSSGEEQLVALSLIGALNKCTNIKSPVFMDTPFGRLDIQHGKRVLSYLPELADQLVLLVTDREFKKEDETILSGKISSDHSIIFKSEREGSIILKTSTLRDQL